MAKPGGEINLIVKAVEAAFRFNPPTIGVIGLSGVGKSSTINAMFGTRRHVSATTRGTARFSHSVFESESNRLEASRVKCALRVYDAPGLGEDRELDENYLKRYRKHLPKCDVALWIIAARNRALALDQYYLERLKDKLPNLVVGINQADLVDPLGWNGAINLPSREQEKSLEVIINDRREKFRRFGFDDLPVIAYSASKYYNLQSLFTVCMKHAPNHRRWMFDIIKGFSTHDWLNRASGLSDAQRKSLAAAYIQDDAKLRLDTTDWQILKGAAT